MSFYDHHHYHKACGHWCADARCDPTAHAVPCATCRLTTPEPAFKMPKLYRMIVAGAFIVIAGLVMADTCGANTPGNAYTYCDHGNRVYDDVSGHGLAVVPQDPTCGGVAR